MKKLVLFLTICAFAVPAFAQQQVINQGKSQFLLIIRFKTDFKAPSDEAVKANIKKWQDYMAALAKSGALVNGYRPAGGGLTISGSAKTLKTDPYISDEEQVSSVLVINAADMEAAKAIAEKCPVFEFGGSIEVRPVMNTAGQQ
ncbi:MAG TPA: YciI family protein [Mucilaginibacter sp.]|nr:YciI family protein [Mucilaginibacter sp.]